MAWLVMVMGDVVAVSMRYRWCDVESMEAKQLCPQTQRFCPLLTSQFSSGSVDALDLQSMGVFGRFTRLYSVSFWSFGEFHWSPGMFKTSKEWFTSILKCRSVWLFLETSYNFSPWSFPDWKHTVSIRSWKILCCHELPCNATWWFLQSHETTLEDHNMMKMSAPQLLMFDKNLWNSKQISTLLIYVKRYVQTIHK